MTAQPVTLPSNRTLSTVNCRNGTLVGGIWTFCTHKGEKVSYSDCKNCPNHDPYDPDFEADSLVTINVYGLSKTEREKRQERHNFQDPLNGDIPRGPECPRLAYNVTFSEGLLKSLSKVQKKGDVFDDFKIIPKKPKLSKLEGGN